MHQQPRSGVKAILSIFNSGITHLNVEIDNVIDAHLRRPRRRCENKDMRSACFLRIDAELNGLPGRLSTSSSNDQDIWEAVLVKGRSC
jgi:hypothetical protein